MIARIAVVVLIIGTVSAWAVMRIAHASDRPAWNDGCDTYCFEDLGQTLSGSQFTLHPSR